MEKQKFFGKILDLDQGDDKKVATAMQKGREDAWSRAPREGETKMSEEEMRFIEKMNLYIQEELREMGIEGVGAVPLRSFRILDREKQSESESRGYNTRQCNQTIMNKREYKSRMDWYFGILHEMTHSLSFHKFYVDPQKKIHNYRTGFQSDRLKNPPSEYLRGLNEAVTDRIAADIFLKHQKEIIKDLNLTNEEISESFSMYHGYQKAVGVIIKKLAGKKGEDEKETWRRYKKTLFTGDILHLRDVEKCFGKGSLRVLGALGYESGSLNKLDVALRVLRYFKTENDYEKDYIAKGILAGRDLEKYSKVNRGMSPVFGKDAKHERAGNSQDLLVKAEDEFSRFENNFLSKIILLIDRMKAIDTEISNIEKDEAYDEKKFSEYQKEKIMIPANGTRQVKSSRSREEDNLSRKMENARKKWQKELDAFSQTRSEWSSRIFRLHKELNREMLRTQELNEQLNKLEVDPVKNYKLDELAEKASVYVEALFTVLNFGINSERERMLVCLEQILWRTA